ncbi:MAG: prepilin-type N-terminal cleavage/methylation domain-containing protein [Verrucomicrobiae bacterium]|nr:prepilin-type N-terminal cleavage/methylation domain-containing protein [Verrucomicrobiae bacterium]
MKKTGFTLLEVVVSVSVFCLLMLAVASVWTVSWRATERIARRDATGGNPQVVLDRLEEAVEAAVFHRQPKSLYAWQGKNGRNEADEISFVTTLAPDAAAASAWDGAPERLEVKWRAVKSGMGELVMSAGPFTLEEWDREVVLLENVAAFRVRYWNKARQDWVDRWEDEDKAPAAVWFGLAMKGEPVASRRTGWAHERLALPRLGYGSLGKSGETTVEGGK